MSDLISRQEAIDALWRALYDYEDKCEHHFQDSDELEIGDWILHRIFVQNMNDIDRKTIRELPSAELPIKEKCCVCPHCNDCDVNEDGTIERKKGEWIKDDEGDTVCSCCGIVLQDWTQGIFYSFCPNCGADMRIYRDTVKTRRLKMNKYNLQQELKDADNCRLPELIPDICKRCRDNAYCHRQLSLDDLLKGEEDDYKRSN